jgi:chromate reductase, NAD(P)H dehydrogenase (quinone)
MPFEFPIRLALRETLQTMAAVIIEEASFSIPLLGADLDESAIVSTPAIASRIRDSIRAIQHAVLSRRDPRIAQLLTTW